MAAALARRRANEALIRERMEYVEDNHKTGQIVSSEKRTTKRIEQKGVLDRAGKMAEADAEDLEKRKEEIRQLYQREMEEWEDMIEKRSRVSTEQRMEEIRAKAYRLRDIREEERRRYIQDCYDRQWRSSSDEARQAESKVIMDRLLQDRTNSDVLDGAKSNRESLEEAKHVEAMEQRKRELDERAAAEQRELEQKNLQMKLALDLQVSMKRDKDLATLREKQQEEARQLGQWLKEEQEAKATDARSAMDNHARGLAILKANAIRLQEREQALAVERKRDEVLLNYALEKEQNDIAKEMEAKEQGNGMAREYMAFLQEQMVKDKADTSRIDAIRNAKMKEIWLKRDAELRAQAEARRRLMTEVDEGRQQQIADKIKQIQLERAEIAEQVLRDIEKAREQDELEREEQARSKARTIEAVKVNLEMSQVLAQEKQALLLERKAVEYEERKHRQRLAEIGGKL